MPNWCENDLYIYGKDRAAVCAAIEGTIDGVPTRFDFNTVLPMPEVLRDTVAGSAPDEGLIVLGKAERGAVERYLGYPWVQAEGVHDEESLKKFLLARIPGCVAEAEKTLKAYDETGYKDWYAWSLDHWGTKWNVTNVFREDQPTRIKLCFSTAWSPPSPVIEALAQKFPTCTFSHRYYERGMAFKGHRKYRKGVLVEESDGSYAGSRGG